MRFELPLVLASVSVLVMLGACGSDDENGNDPKAFFVSKVYPQIQPTCGDCHAQGKRGAPIFMADNAEGSYKAIEETPGYIAPPTFSPLVQKGLHSGPAFTDVQNKIVAEWLLKEPKGGTSNTSKPGSLRAAFKLFGQCMDYNEWKSYNLDKLSTFNSGMGQCLSCHGEGQASFFASPNPQETFTKLSEFPYVQRLVTGTVDDQGHFDKIVDANRLIQKGVEAPVNYNRHPPYNFGSAPGLVPAEVQEGLRKFISGTITKMGRVNGCSSVSKPDGGADGG